MATTENYDLPRIAADLAKCKQRLADMDSAGAAGRHDGGIGYQKQRDSTEAAIMRLGNEYIQAKLNTPEHKGGWRAAHVIDAMEATTRPIYESAVDRQTSAHIDTASRHLERGNHAKAKQHLIAAAQLCATPFTEETT